ncbi:MAG: hypothetical protein ACP5KA_02560 [Desulfurococcaceae archaeon]
MTIYWDRCDLCGLHRPVRRCTLVSDISVDAHCCIACVHWMTSCTNPAWKFEVPRLQQTTRRGAISPSEKQKLLEELVSLIESSGVERKARTTK